MKVIFKWASIFVIPSTIFFLYLHANAQNASDELKAVFFVMHFFNAGAAIFFTLIEMKKRSTEVISAMRYIITGIFTAVSHGLIFGLVSGVYFTYIAPEAKQSYIDDVLTPAIVRGFDSSSNTKAEYYAHLMEGKDTAVLLPERHRIYEQAAQDSLAKIDNVIETIVQQNFSISGSMKKWISFAPIIGILFSVLITVFVTKR